MTNTAVLRVRSFEGLNLELRLDDNIPSELSKPGVD